MKRACALALLPWLSGCTAWLFSGESWTDRSRPVALIETTGGIELGATTEFGVLTLGRRAATGPCRVHYFVGPTPLVETGELIATGSVFTRAEIDLKTQHLRALDRPLTREDALVAMWTPDGRSTRSVTVRLAELPDATGDLLADPGLALPTGATVLCRGDDGGFLFAGLIAMRATITTSGQTTAVYGFAGLDRVRELLAVPSRHPVDVEPKYRTDDISVLKAQPPVATESGPTTESKVPAKDAPKPANPAGRQQQGP